MSTVLVIGPNYFNFLSAAKNAFERMGWKVLVEDYDNPVHPYTHVMRWRWKLSRHREQLQKLSRERYNTYILRKFQDATPDFVFIMNGDILFSSTLDTFRKTAKVALWLFDTLDKLPTSVEIASHVDKLFCYEQKDAEWFQQKGIEAYFLPQAYDPSSYYPITLPKDIDILFVGNLYTSPKRMRLIQAVVQHFPDKRIIVYGLYKPWYKGFFRWLFREKRTIYKNKMIDSVRVNELYNRSRVVLNIHIEQQRNGANPRTFEIPGSGAWQVCDRNPYIESLFSFDEIGLFHTTEELFARINEGLEEDKTQAAASAHQVVLSRHSFDVRMSEVLRIAGLHSS